MPLESRRHVAVVGCGQWGRNIVRILSQLERLAAICDPDAAAAEGLAVRYGVPVRSFDQLLADPAIEALAIAAPAALHAKLTEAALSAEKHVFVEKPIALARADAERLCDLADRQDRRLMVGHLLQYHPAFVRLLDLVGAGELGRLRYIYSNRLNLGRIRREEDILWSFAPHDISMILSLFGQEPDRVEAIGSYCLHPTIADVTTTHLEFPSGGQAHVFVSWLHPFKEQKLVVVGDRAMAVFNDGEPWESKLMLYRHHVEWRKTTPVPQKADGEPVAVESGEPLLIEIRHFLDCVETGRRPRTDGHEGLRVLDVLTRASDAMKRNTGAVAEPSQHRATVQIHETVCIDEPVQIGDGTRIWHFSHLLANTRVGRNCTIGQNVVIGPDVTVGDGCKIQNNVSIYKGVTLEDGVFCGPACVFTNVLNPRAEIDRKAEFQPTLVRRGATIGANATIVCGVTLGDYCMIGAGAVVTRDVPAFALMAGVPAVRIGWVGHGGERLGPDMVCRVTGRRYRETDDGTLKELTGDAGAMVPA